MERDRLQQELALCVQNAGECRNLANQASQELARSVYSASAQSWDYLAAKLEQTITGSQASRHGIANR